MPIQIIKRNNDEFLQLTDTSGNDCLVAIKATSLVRIDGRETQVTTFSGQTVRIPESVDEVISAITAQETAATPSRLS